MANLALLDAQSVTLFLQISNVSDRGAVLSVPRHMRVLTEPVTEAGTSSQLGRCLHVVGEAFA